ncbi:MAG: peptidoglycan-binding protein, partial [Methanobrevibacter sp.]|nr:peptidoglycan-binding protein [Methanobrevibacter sp.]
IAFDGDNVTISGCVFINNTAKVNGGAIAFDGDNVTISGCVFINNTANKGGGAIAIPLADNFRINNNIFLNNKDGYGEVIFLSILANYNIDYNWFGNTALNYKIKQNYGVDHWLFLNATANPDELTILDTSEITFKLYLYTEDGIREYNNSLMPPVNLTLSSVNGDLSSYSAGLDDSVTFTPLSRATAEISAKWETVEYSIQLEVKGADSKLNVTLSPTEISFGDNATLHLEYNPNATGTVNISIAGKKHKYSMEDIGLNASVILSGLLPDEYNITVIYSGDENFTGATLTPEDSLTVKMLPSNMEVTSFDIYVNDTNGVMFNISLDESATGSLKLSGDIEKEISLNDGQKENGKTVILIENTGLAVGKYNVSFSYSGDEIYENSTESSLSRIMIIQTQVIAKNDSIELTAGDESWMEYTLIPSDAVGEITFSSNDTTVVEVNSTGEIRAVGEGIAMVTITFSGNENYTSSNATVEVKVNRIDTEIDIDSGSPVAHNSTNATITLKSAGGDIPNQEIKVTIRDGNGNVLYNDSALTGNDGSLKVSYTPLSVSPITITAVFDGSTVYNGSGNEITADPSEIETVLNIDVKDTVVDGKTDIIINITDINGNAVEGTVSLSFDDDTEDVRLDINNLKQLIYTYNNTNRGKNVKVTAVLNVPAGSGYGDSNDSAQFNVARLNSTITSDNITAVYGSGDYLLIALKDINGNAIAGVNISVNLNGISQYSTDENGTVKVSTMNLDVNGYTAEITFAGNERYIESETAVNVTIEPAGSSVSAQNVNISYGDILSINVVSENATNVTYEIRDENDGYVTGEVIAPNETISGLDFAAGKYTLNLTANVDGNHISSSSLYNITVNKASSIINADNVEIIYGETVNLTVSSVNTTELTYKITDKDKSTIANGTIQSNDEIILSNLDAGEYTVEISYGGNENYTGSNASAKITVSPAKSSVSGENVTVTYGDAVSINVVSENATAVDYNVLDSNGVSVKTGTVDSNGIITDLDLAAGKYTLNLTAVVDSNHVSSSASSSITVNKASSLLATEDVNVTYGNEVSINVSSINATELTYKVIDSGGKTVANGTVKANGTITVKGLSAGKYTVEIIFAGNENYTASSADSSITVKKASPKITAKAKTFKIEDKTKKYTVTLKNNKGKVMKNIKVTLKVNGVTYTAKTNSNGVATFKLTKLNRTGSFTAVIGYAGNNNYKKVTKKVKLTVKYTWKTISRGSKDKAMVKKIQRALKKNHFYISYKGRHLKVDGIFHVYTEMAVKEFQRAKKLKVTGKVDYATAKKLKLVK